MLPPRYNQIVNEQTFVETNQEVWKRLENVVEESRRLGPTRISSENLRTLASDYRAVVAHLSYARTQGAGVELVAFLNDLAGRAHGVLYVAPRARFSSALMFLTREFPMLFRQTWRATLLAGLIFASGWGAGVYVVNTDPSLMRSLIPERIAQRESGSTEINIPDPAAMSSHIMTNNIKVGIYAFAAGITAGLLTAVIVFYNGLAIGAVATVAAPALGPARFWSYILPHGIIELTAIFISAGAGLLIGGALIAPGNLRRADALRIASRKGLLLFAGTLPFYVFAAIIEGFLTPSVLPVWSKLGFAGVTAAVMAAYLAIRPVSESSP